MKNIQNYTAEKYSTADYERMEEGIYKTKNPYGSGEDDFYVSSLTFEHEPDMPGEEEGSPRYISQTPLEDLLDKFFVCVTDFYEDLNENSEVTCYQEFGSSDIEDVRKLRSIIGKRVYAKILWKMMRNIMKQ